MLKANPKDITLWVLARRLDEVDGKSIRARALFEKARLVNSKSEVVRVEGHSGAYVASLSNIWHILVDGDLQRCGHNARCVVCVYSGRAQKMRE
jgi:hypothetical protein